MLHLISRFQEISAGRVKEIRNVVVDPVSTYLNDPAESKANTAEECQRVWRERIQTLIQLFWWEDLSVHLYEQTFPYRTPPVRFLPPIESSADISSYKFKDSKNHFQWSRYLSRENISFALMERGLGSRYSPYTTIVRQVGLNTANEPGWSGRGNHVAFQQREEVPLVDFASDHAIELRRSLVQSRTKQRWSHRRQKSCS
jgi:hypothetical protein